MTENQGIHVSGGHLSISGGAVAAGPYATANYQAAPPAAADALRQVDLILTLIRRHREVLPDADVAEQVALKVRAELTAANPDPDRVTGAVSRLTKRVAAVGALAAAASRLQQVISALFG